MVDHYDNPRNVGSMDKKDPNVGTALVGAPACGDVMKLQIKVRLGLVPASFAAGAARASGCSHHPCVVPQTTTDNRALNVGMLL